MRQPREQILQLHNGDCFEVLRALPDNSIDCCVTDAPYGLNSKEPDMADVLKHWLAGDDAPVKGAGFMGKAWDKFVPGPAVWREVFRVLKPGGHLLSFFGSRTYDMGTLAIRLAGFEIRDQIMWVYGSGFPKSLDVSKAIDKNNGRTIEDTYELGRHIKAQRRAAGYSVKKINEIFGAKALCNHWEAQNINNAIAPTVEHWEQLKNLLRCDPQYDSVVERLAAEREVIGSKKSGIANKDEGYRHTIGASKSVTVDITAASTENAKQWEGWGTALKPAHEPICVARKPLAGTVAANVLAYGTGGLNIDDCRVPTDEQIKGGSGGLLSHQRDNTEYPGTDWQPSAQGRWPTNLVHDGSDEVLATFPDAKGQQGALTGHEPSGKMGSANCYGKMDRRHEAVPRIDSSKSAARFFYCAKASKADRNYGLSGEDIASSNLVGREEGSAGTQSPRAGAGRTTGSKNPHPTVKPVALMRWLVRLVTPPGGRVLDPFMGSGSTGVATALEGFRFTGIELEPQFYAVASERIYFARKEAVKNATEQPPAEV